MQVIKSAKRRFPWTCPVTRRNFGAIFDHLVWWVEVLHPLLMGWTFIALLLPLALIPLTWLTSFIVFSLRMILAHFLVLVFYLFSLNIFKLPLILPVLAELFKYILTSSTFPLVWKISSLVPIPKVNSPTEKTVYCPISILPVLAKAFENVMYEQMVNYVGRNGFISSFHSGLRPGHRTATAIARVSDDTRLNMESN
jgi:hypothetical protein